MLTISSMSVAYSKEPVVGDTSEVLNYVKIWLNFDLAYFAHEIAILVLIILSKRLISSPTRARKALYMIFQCYSLLWLFWLRIEQIWLPAVLDCHYVRVGSWVYIKISIKIAYFEYRNYALYYLWYEAVSGTPYEQGTLLFVKWNFEDICLYLKFY